MTLSEDCSLSKETTTSASPSGSASAYDQYIQWWLRERVRAVGVRRSGVPRAVVPEPRRSRVIILVCASERPTDRPTDRPLQPSRTATPRARIDSLSATRQTCSTFFPSLSPCLADSRSFKNLGSLCLRVAVPLCSPESVLVLEEKYWVHRWC